MIIGIQSQQLDIVSGGTDRTCMADRTIQSTHAQESIARLGYRPWNACWNRQIAANMVLRLRCAVVSRSLML